MKRTVNDKSPSFQEEAWDFLKTLLICMVVVFTLSNYVIRPIRVDGSSMYPTLQDGNVGFSNLIGRKMNGVKRFDIVIIYIPEKDEYLVKRVIGLPNETVTFDHDTLSINGEVVDQDFLNTTYEKGFLDGFTKDSSNQDTFEIKLHDDEYYCLGDNRPDSLDSRYYGPFKGEQLTSKGVLVIWPFKEFGVKTW